MATLYVSNTAKPRYKTEPLIVPGALAVLRVSNFAPRIGDTLNPVSPNAFANFTVEHRVGRLVQTRVTALTDLRDMCNMQAALHSVLSGVVGQAVICTDWTQLRVLSPGIAESVCQMLTTTNNKVLRGAILLDPEQATFNLQVDRVIREAGSLSRRTFRDTVKMVNWLAEVTTPEEVACAREFLMLRD
jgi:hypothetical protein